MKSKYEIINDIVDNINAFGCRLTFPYDSPSPITVLFEGGFSDAAYIRTYPSTLFIYGMNGQVAISDIHSVENPSNGVYVVEFGRDQDRMDIMVKINT